jgi:hypothetical protein
MQEAQQAEDMPLLRRSFDYETYAESGLAFLASAPLPAVLRLAVVRFMEDRDELTRSVGLSETGRGLFVVPPDGAWLRGAAAQDLPSLPGWVTDFRRQHSFVHYEVSPKTADFLQQTFRMNSERLLEGGELRPDLQLLVGGIVKLLLGHRIPNGSLCYQFLTRAFGPKTGAQPSRQNRPLGLARAELADLIDESVEEDARSPVLNTKLAALIQLGIEGAQEAKEINAEAGDYVTFSI